ncbi:alpha/beta fold hydrolase [Thermobifida halotolerans]|uniref:Alpha/beta fold hydrolase n=1 Tax=Thermobifida halotolerans TaxID=483545 RepID=A0AA97LZ30_9ACTN|nr:alpha/beta fold hydrolase [Thermobifida halotolerans]UOE20750.1 alpha/beta fold hydrolase [Thermobifida halotolerans]
MRAATAGGRRLEGHRLDLGAQWLHVRTGRPIRRTGTPVLLVPGLVSSSRYLEPVGAELARDRLVVAPDLPGTGRSPRADTPLSLTDLAGVLHRVMLRTTGPAIVVGNSFGCQTAVELAVRHPEAVTRLVLTSPVLAPRNRGLLPLTARFVAAMRRESPRYLAIMLVDVLRASFRKERADLRALRTDRILRRAGDLTVPTLVVCGTRDPIVPPAFARRLAARIPVGRYREIDATHALPYAAPRVLADLVRDADGESSGG